MSTYTTTGATEMDHMDRTLTIQTLAYGGQITTIYTRADLGIDTAVISQDRPDGRWVACLYDGADEPDERDRRAGIHRREARDRALPQLLANR